MRMKSLSPAAKISPLTASASALSGIESHACLSAGPVGLPVCVR